MKAERFWRNDSTLWESNCSIRLHILQVSTRYNLVCFYKTKTKLNGELRELVYLNINLAIIKAVEFINAQDMAGVFEATSYLFA